MVVIDLGYRKIVVTKEQAMQLAGILETAEIYDEKYWSEAERKAKGIPETYTFHIYPNDNSYTMKLISDAQYQMAKLAGKPTKE
jgi:hypothetical protein